MNVFAKLLDKILPDEEKFYRKVNKALQERPLEFKEFSPKDGWYVFESGKIKVWASYIVGRYIPFIARMNEVTINLTPEMYSQVAKHFRAQRKKLEDQEKEEYSKLISSTINL